MVTAGQKRFMLRSYQAGWELGRRCKNLVPVWSREKLLLVANSLRTYAKYEQNSYREGFILAYLAKFDENGTQLPNEKEDEEMAKTAEQVTKNEGTKTTAADKIAALKAKAQEAVNNPAKADATDEYEKVSYVNNLQISGHLGKDAEFTYTPTGKGICKSSLAVWQPGKDAPTIWLDLVMWLAEGENDVEFSDFAEMEKGAGVVVEGRLGMRTYNNKQYYSITVKKVTG